MSVAEKLAVLEGKIARLSRLVARIDAALRPSAVDMVFRGVLVRSRAAYRGHVTRLLPKIVVPPAVLPPPPVIPVIEKVEKVWRSFVSGLIYCGGRERQVGVGTFTEVTEDDVDLEEDVGTFTEVTKDDVDLEEDLLAILIDKVADLSDECSPLQPDDSRLQKLDSLTGFYYGYEHDQITRKKKQEAYFWPEYFTIGV